jgi:uncharacterized membrane protein YgdD (TMEM256/DUF423 family)
MRKGLGIAAVINFPALRRQDLRAAGNVMGVGTVLFAGQYLHIEQTQAIDKKYRDKKNP